VAVSEAVAQIEAELGPVSGVLHAAGLNRPSSLASLTTELMEQTLAPKVLGLENLLGALEGRALKWVISFGSIIARIGLQGEAHYAHANAWMARVLAAYGKEHPGCRCLNTAWSVWSGVGMGERLGTVDHLRRAGITAITTDTGLDTLARVLDDAQLSGEIVIAGRFGEPSTVRMHAEDPPFLRFLEKICYAYPEVELVAEAKLSAVYDPYLSDHIYDESRVFPAVMGIEAMSQAVVALSRGRIPNRVTDLRLNKPITIPKNGERKIRIAVLRRDANTYEAVIRSDQTHWANEHFRATLHLSEVTAPAAIGRIEGEPRLTSAGFYGDVFFHSGRFRRVIAFDRLEAYALRVRLSPSNPHDWFNRVLPGEMIVGDPGIQDATLHAVQACIPHKSVLPLSVGSFTRYDTIKGMTVLEGRETRQEDDVYYWDVVVAEAETGRVLAQWHDLAFKEIRELDRTDYPHPVLETIVAERLRGLTVSAN
jgi:enediyne polyketide synthase